MSLSHYEQTLEAVVARLTKLEEVNAKMAELEQAHAQLQEELATLRNAQPLIPESTRVHNQKTLLAAPKKMRSSRRASRRGVLKKVFGTAAVTVGAVALLQVDAGSAHADGNEGPTTFTGTSTQPAVTANGVSSVDAIDANANSGIAVNAFSLSGTAITALGGGNNPAIKASSDRGYAVSAVSNSTTGVYAKSTSGAGMVTISTSGDGLYASSVSSNGVVAKSKKGTALYVVGRIQVIGNAVGQAILRAGSISVTVSTSVATPTSNIMLTPLDDPAGRLWVTLGSGTFTINSSASPTNDVVIEYFIIN
jgi:hypothetical protein